MGESAVAVSEALAERYRKALESLVPMGSEFVGEPERCARFVTDRLRGTVKIAIDRNQWRARAQAAEDAIAALNSPTPTAKGDA